MKLIKTSVLLFSFIMMGTFGACLNEGIPSFDISNIEGMIPIYESDLTIERIASQNTRNQGKIITYEDFILITEIGAGIHVVDNSDPRLPNKIFFYSIAENNDMVIKDGILYLDNGPDLVGIDFTKEELTIVSTLKNVFYDEGFEDYPSQNNVYYQCPDPLKGKVIGWKKSILVDPDCYKRAEI
ncbi:MAG: hypothetical protein AB8B73_06575 [Ekhidna sp.]